MDIFAIFLNEKYSEDPFHGKCGKIFYHKLEQNPYRNVGIFHQTENLGFKLFHYLPPIIFVKQLTGTVCARAVCHGGPGQRC